VKYPINILEDYDKLTKRQYEEITSWMNAGKGALTAQVQMLANPINNQVAMSTYYSSPDTPRCSRFRTVL
jgi:hypothetical protein